MRRSMRHAILSAAAAAAVCLGAALAPAPARADYLGFADVSPSDWAAEQGYIDYVASEGLMSGLSETSFGPAEPLSRAQVATVLWRVAGEPEPDAGVERFPDCDYSEDSFYGEAVSWARSVGVVGGYENGTFGPADSVTREQLATMLARYAGRVAGLDASSDGSALDAMADSGFVTLWDGMAWAVDAGVLTGDMSTGEPLALPRASAQRDQAAKMFSVFHRDVLGEGDGDLELPEGVGLSDGVTLVPADEYDMTGELSATLDGTAADVGVGDVIVLSPTEENPGGAAIRVTSVSESAGGTRVSGVTPELDEVVDELDVSGTTTELVSVDLAEGVELVDARTGAAVPMFEGSLDLVDKSFKIKGIGTIGIESSLDYDIDYSWGRFKTLALTLNAEADFDTSLTATTGDRSVRIGTLSFKTGVPGLTVDLDLYFTYSASGGMELWATASASAGLRYEDGEWSSHADKDFAYGVSLSGQVKAGIEPALVLELLSIDIVDASVELGGVVDGLTQVRQSGMVCNDLSAWMYVDLAIGQHGSVADDLGLSKVFHIVTEKNSPRWDQHTENGELVPVCTWDPGADEEPDEEEPSNPGGEDPDNPETPEGPTTDASDFTYVIGDGVEYGNLYGTASYGYGAYITGYKGSSSDVVIPASIDGVDVLYVGISDSGRTIKSLDFSHAKSLRDINLYIGEYDVNFGKLDELERVAATLSCCFTGDFDLSQCGSLKHLIFSDGAHLGGYMRFGTESLETISIGITNIAGTFTIGDAPRLREAEFVDVGISDIIFGNCPSLEKLTVINTDITNLDVSEFPQLKELVCFNNNISDTSALEAWASQPGHTANLVGYGAGLRGEGK